MNRPMGILCVALTATLLTLCGCFGHMVWDRTTQINRSEKTVAVEWVRCHPGAIHYKLESGMKVQIKFLDPPERYVVRWQRAGIAEKYQIRYSAVANKGYTEHFYTIIVPDPYPLNDKDPE